MNATGEGDKQDWCDAVANYQQHTLLQPLTELVRFAFRASNGPTKGVEPAKWSIQFAPLREETAEQKSARQLVLATVAEKLITTELATPEEISLSWFAQGGPFEDVAIDLDLREKILDIEKTRMEKEAVDPPPPPPVKAFGVPNNKANSEGDAP